MDHKRISKLLKKISSINQNIEEDEEFSSMEMEHMLNYIKKLYEEASGSALEHAETVAKKKKAKTKEAPAKVEAVVEEVAEVEEVAVVEEVVEVEEAVAVVKAAQEPIVVPELVVEVPKIDSELLALFDAEGGTDLSDKLASRPIKTLTKAMGINEKIFTVKELFGGDQKEFDNMMVALDGLGSFDEAKDVLVGSVAEKYDWSSDKKLKKAETFIKLVRRRYN